MRIRDHQLDAAQAATRERAQKLGPEGLGLGDPDRDAQHLAPAIAVNRHRDDHSDRDDAPLLADLHVGCIEPEVRPLALQRAVEEGRNLVVDLAAQAADLALGNAGHAHRLDQLVDRAGRDALDVGFLDHRGERLLGHPPRLQKAREITAAAQLGDAQLDRAGARLPNPVAVSITVIDPLSAALAVRGAGQALDLQFHQTLRGKPNHLAQQLGIRTLLQQRANAHHLVGHRRLLGSVEWLQPNPTDDPR